MVSKYVSLIGGLVLVASSIVAADPLATATRWTELFEGRLEPGATPQMMVDRGHVKFVRGTTAGGIIGLDLAVHHPKSHLDRAEKLGIRTGTSAVRIGGTEMRVREAG
jgi:hypothetical protein